MNALAALVVTSLLTAAPAAQLRRFALIAGTNDGGKGRVPLRYAESDARSVASVLQSLGGVREEDSVLALNPDRAALEGALAELRRKIAASAAPGVRTEAVVYYSGHSDENGLLPKGELISFAALRRALAGLPADVRIAVLDSCASGALTRGKGGVARPPFLSDASSQVKGYAFLASSTENEVAQESDKIAGSFFTHYLVSGLRGAADVTRDGRVTLNEAYQFAFQETLARTEATRGGPQHPAYDIQLVGSGDLVMTDLRETPSRLRIASDVAGRVFVRDDSGRLVVELPKHAGHPLELGVEPGEYRVSVEQGGQWWRTAVKVNPGARSDVSMTALASLVTEKTRARGGHSEPVAAGEAALTPPPGADATSAGGALVSPSPRADAAGAEQHGEASPESSRGVVSAESSRGVVSAESSRGLVSAESSRGAGLGRGDSRGAPSASSPEGSRGASTVAVLIPDEAADSDGEQAVLVRAADSDEAATRYRPVNVSLIPALSINGSQDRDIENSLALGLPFARGGVLQGVSLSLVGSWFYGDANGLQFAFGGNWAGGDVRGVQLAFGANGAGRDMALVQLAMGLNYAGRNVWGVQGAFGANWSSGEVSGVQLALGMNRARALNGIQVTVGVNTAERVAGFQGALGVNVAKDVAGVQVAGVNVAKSVKGLQIGFINIADEVDAPIGLVNIVRNGRGNFSVYASETHFMSAAFRYGGRILYTMLDFGYQPRRGDSVPHYAVGIGMGGHIPLHPVYIDIEAVISHVRYSDTPLWKGLSNGMGTLRAALGWQPVKHFALYAGPSLNIWVNGDENRGGIGSGPEHVLSPGSPLSGTATTLRIFPGFHAGIQL